MPSNPAALSGNAFVLFTVALSLLLCALLAWLANFRLKSFFPQPGRRLLTLFTATQALLLSTNLVMALGGQGLFPVHLWYLDYERTIPSVHSTIQLLFLTSLCCMNGLAAGLARMMERAWWLVLGLALIFMAAIEYGPLARNFFTATLLAGAAGVFLLWSLLIIWRRGRDGLRRNGLLLLLGGLGLWAVGTFLLDYPTFPVRVKALEETVETLGIALAHAGAAGFFVAHRSQRHFPLRRLLASLCLTNLALALVLFSTHFWDDSLYPQIRYLWRVAGTPITVDVDEGALALRSWKVAALKPGTLVKVNLWLHTTRPLESDFGFTVQLIDQASQDATLTFNQRSGIDTRHWRPGKLFNRQLVGHFHLPENAPVDRAQWLTLSFWKITGDDFLPLKISASDYPTLGDTHVILDEVVLPDLTTPPLQGEPPATFDNGFALQRAVLPARARAGDEMTVDFLWSSESAGGEDWTQFLQFVHRETGNFWSVDRYPLGRRLPTRLWYAGLQSAEQWMVALPADPEPGPWLIYTGLYRLADMERLALTLADGTRPADRRIPLGSLFVDS